MRVVDGVLLEALQVERVAPGHCTGIRAWRYLAARLGNRACLPMPAGSVFEFGSGSYSCAAAGASAPTPARAAKEAPSRLASSSTR
jgi:hypothetical protein